MVDRGGSAASRGAGLRLPTSDRSPIATNVQTTAATTASATTDHVGNIDRLGGRLFPRLRTAGEARPGTDADVSPVRAAGTGTVVPCDTSGNSAITRMPRLPQAEHRPARAAVLNDPDGGGKGRRKPATLGRQAAQYARLSPLAYDGWQGCFEVRHPTVRVDRRPRARTEPGRRLRDEPWRFRLHGKAMNCRRTPWRNTPARWQPPARRPCLMPGPPILQMPSRKNQPNLP